MHRNEGGEWVWSSDEEGDSDDETIQKKKTAKQVFWFSWLEIFTAIRLDFYWKAIWTLLLCFSVFANSIFVPPKR